MSLKISIRGSKCNFFFGYRKKLLFLQSENKMPVMSMRRIICYIGMVMAVAMMACADGYAQSSLAGQSFANSNIGFKAGELSGINAMIDSKRDSLINVKEKELGRKLTDKETAKIDEKIADGKQLTGKLLKNPYTLTLQ